jgi:hypothetical protein
MHIFIDEAGLFIYSPLANTWSIVGALVIPDSQYKSAHRALQKFKQENALITSSELQRNSYSQESYESLLSTLAAIGCTAYFIGMDGGYQNKIDILRTNKINAVKAWAKTLTGTELQSAAGVESQLAEVSAQLFFQAMCHMQLMYQITNRALSFYDIRYPDSLARFNWRVDRKDLRTVTKMEKIIESIASGVVSSRTGDFPLKLFDSLAYSFFPYFTDLPADNRNAHGGIDLVKLMFDSYALRNSRRSPGLQLSDLVIGGIRRCLKGNFDDNKTAAEHISRLLVRPPGRRENVVELYSYGNAYKYRGKSNNLFRAFNIGAQSILG